MSNNLFSILGKFLPEQKALSNLPAVIPRSGQQAILPAFYDPTGARLIGNEITLYPAKDGEGIIAKGYNLNSVVHTCVKIITKMFGQIPFYVVELDKNERKTWSEYLLLSKHVQDPRAMQEAKRMRRKSIDGIMIDGKLSRFLNKPNRNQSGTAYREQLIGYKKLTGEGNQWFNRGVEDGRQRTDQAPFEMFIIPKYVLQLVGNGVDPWEILKYQLTLNNSTAISVPKENLLMWIEQNYQFDGVTLNHLRGFAPLEAALLDIQALNEGAVREIKEAVNGGANGLLYRSDAKELPANPDVVASMRRQINAAVNGKDVAGTVAWMAGEWGYLPFGKTSQEMQRVELTKQNMVDIANVLGVPPGLLFTDQTYENAPAFWKRLVYQTIAPEAYSLRDAWNNTLLPMFNMDPERYCIDCDIMALPELAEDLKDQVAAVQNANWLSVNEKRIATGYEPAEGEEYDFVPVNDGPIGGPLDNEQDLLNNP